MIIKDQSWARCDHCGHSCPLEHLEKQVYRSPASAINQQIHDCLAEDRRRGSRGGGSGDKGPKKEDKLGSRSVRQLTWGEDDARVSSKVESLEPKDAWLSVRGLPEGISGETVRKAIERKLGL